MTDTPTTPTPSPPAVSRKGRLTHNSCQHGHILWHWYEDAAGVIQVCGANRKACEDAARADGYDIAPEVET